MKPHDIESDGDSDATVVHCEHGERCGGCSLLGLTQQQQLAHKHGVVSVAHARFGLLRRLPVKQVGAAESPLGYRTRAKLVVSQTGEIGLYARGTHDVVDIPECRVLSPELLRVTDVLRARIRAGRTGLSGIDLREVLHDGKRGVLVTLIGPSSAAAALEGLGRDVAQIDGVVGVARSERERDAPTFFGAPPVVLSGKQAVPDELLAGRPYSLATHGSFVQANRAQAAAIATRVIDATRTALGGLSGARVLELYAGAGGLALCLQKLGAKPTLVERYGAALDGAREAARSQGLGDIATHAGDALQVLHRLVQAGERFDAVIVNPPRSGLPPAVRAALCGLGVRVIVYVSCDPETLARDLNHLSLLGYAARCIEPFDMMPLTDSVESIAVLLPSPIPDAVILYEDDDLIAVDKPPHLATTPEGGQARSLLAIVRAQRDLPELAAVHRLDIGTSGVCLLAKHKAAVASLAAALKAGEKQYLTMARGITRDKGSIRRALRERGRELQARTRYSRLQVIGGHSLLRVRPDEGRTHQIRRHLAALGHPVLGDERYGDPASNRHFELAHGLDRTFLHLARIELILRGTALVLEAELPGDLVAIRDRLEQQPRPGAASAVRQRTRRKPARNG